MSSIAADQRERQITDFLAAQGWGQASRAPIAGDASFRRYLRLGRGSETAVLMDAPPPHEDVEAFHRVACLLRDLGFSAPRPLAMAAESGLLLLEDLGDRTFTRALDAGAKEDELYALAVDLLIALHRRFATQENDTAALPPYDDALLLAEAQLFTDWYLPAITGRSKPAALGQRYQDAWLPLFQLARRVPASLVLRDYHVDNLMVIEQRSGIAACGLLDFQDAVIGPRSYDLVSLLEDARRDVAPAVVAAMQARYLDAFPDLDRAAFTASYAILGAQRNAKIIGIFTRLWRRDGKAHYLRHIPRVWRLLEGDLAHPALASVKAWFDEALPADERLAPDPEPGR